MKPGIVLAVTAVALSACAGGDNPAVPQALVADPGPFDVVVAQAEERPPEIQQAEERPPEIEPVTVSEPVPDQPPALVDATQLDVHSSVTPMNPDRDNNGVPYIDKPVVTGTYRISEDLSDPSECPIEVGPTCEPWVWTLVHFEASWPNVEQAAQYNVYAWGDPVLNIDATSLAPLNTSQSYSITVQLFPQANVDTVVSQMTYQVEALEFRGFTSGWTAPVVWTEVF